jgi:hypothetical protein
VRVRRKASPSATPLRHAASPRRCSRARGCVHPSLFSSSRGSGGLRALPNLVGFLLRSRDDCHFDWEQLRFALFGLGSDLIRSDLPCLVAAASERAACLVATRARVCLPGSDVSLARSLFSLSCILLCAVRNDGLRTQAVFSSFKIPPRSPSPVAVPDCSPLYGGTLWLVHTFSPPPNRTDYRVER